MDLCNRLKHGCVREDGKIFIGYEKKCKNGERWITKESFEDRKKIKHLYYLKNKDKIVSRGKEWIKNNRKRATEARKSWHNRNPQKRRDATNKYRKKRLEADPLYLLNTRLRASTGQAFRRMGYTKNSRTYEYIGCEWDFLKVYIEKKFKEGMCWNNKNLWHIDHIIPLASAQSENDLIKLCHYTNLQPLWAKENQKKSNKIQ